VQKFFYLLYKKTDIKWRLKGYMKEGKTQRMGAHRESTEK
jgi:hypothetical protein